MGVLSGRWKEGKCFLLSRGEYDVLVFSTDDLSVSISHHGRGQITPISACTKIAKPRWLHGHCRPSPIHCPCRVREGIPFTAGKNGFTNRSWDVELLPNWRRKQDAGSNGLNVLGMSITVNPPCLEI